MSFLGVLVAVVEALNGLGVAFTSNPSSSPGTQELGSKLIKASLAFQLAVIVVCFVLAELFHRNCVKSGICTTQIKTPLVVLSFIPETSYTPSSPRVVLLGLRGHNDAAQLGGVEYLASRSLSASTS
ncbi:hypothetical protein QM012_000026 [Aureobasidium pullulans]|uniref:Uncharacterized protein n=1 Tax=Aureobasidium pullulans TaxID=5580 RepID=A0ABR0TUM9_AURPU